jgi:hypothetical protein
MKTMGYIGGICLVFCSLCVTFRLRQHIGMTQLSAIEKPTISANDRTREQSGEKCEKKNTVV